MALIDRKRRAGTSTAQASDDALEIRTSRIKQDERGIWNIHFCVPDPRRNGGRRTKTYCTQTTDRKIAEAILDTWRDDKRLELKDAEGYTIGDVIDLYLRECGDDIGATSRQPLVYLRETIGTMLPREFDQAFVNAYRRSRLNRRTGQPLASGTVLKDLVMLRVALLHAVQRKKIDANDLHGKLRLPEKGAPRTRCLDDEEWQTVWDAAYADRAGFGLFVLIAMETAARKSAIHELTWDRIHLGTPGHIDFRNPKRRAEKNKKRPQVGISSRLRPILVEAKAARITDRVFPFSMLNNYRSERFFGQLNLPGSVTLHTLRHSWATRKLAKGASIAIVAEIMGDTPEVVWANYKHLVPQHGADVLDL